MRKLYLVLLAALIPLIASAATVTYTATQTPDGQTDTLLVTWTPLLNGDTGQSSAISTYADRTVQVTGTFGSGGTVTFEGSNDGTNYSTLTDLAGNAISKTSAGVSVIAENPRFVRPHVTAGDGTTSITVTLIGKR